MKLLTEALDVRIKKIQLEFKLWGIKTEIDELDGYIIILNFHLDAFHDITNIIMLKYNLFFEFFLAIHEWKEEMMIEETKKQVMNSLYYYCDLENDGCAY